MVLDDLHDMESLAEVALFPQYKTKYRFHKLTGDRVGEYAIDLDKQNRITFVPDEEPPPVKDDGSLNLEAVTAICITFVGDYHD